MPKLLGVLIALVIFGALPAVAAAQTPPDEGDVVSSGNTQDADIEQEAEAGGNGGNGHHGHNGGGGNAGNQAAICQQNAGADAICDINQSQNFGAGDHRRHHGHGGHHGHDGQGGHGVGGFGVGGGGVHGVALARTGFDAWILAALGGLALAGGIGLLAAQRRGRLSA